MPVQIDDDFSVADAAAQEKAKADAAAKLAADNPAPDPRDLALAEERKKREAAEARAEQQAKDYSDRLASFDERLAATYTPRPTPAPAPVDSGPTDADFDTNPREAYERLTDLKVKEAIQSVSGSTAQVLATLSDQTFQSNVQAIDLAANSGDKRWRFWNKPGVREKVLKYFDENETTKMVPDGIASVYGKVVGDMAVEDESFFTATEPTEPSVQRRGITGGNFSSPDDKYVLPSARVQLPKEDKTQKREPSRSEVAHWNKFACHMPGFEGPDGRPDINTWLTWKDEFEAAEDYRSPEGSEAPSMNESGR